jgi:hypothetical protein
LTSKNKVQFDVIDVTPELQPLDGRIIECKMVDGKWVFVRERWDKRMPNTIITTMGESDYYYYVGMAPSIIV